MPDMFEWNPAYSNAFIAIVYTAIGFAAYWFIAESNSIKKNFFNNGNDEQNQVRYVVFQKLVGVLFLGIIPAVYFLSSTEYSLAKLGLQLGDYKHSLMYITGMAVLILIMNYFASSNPKNLERYPQMRLKEWNKKRVAADASSWAAYLLAYEFLFRGVLLFVCVDAFGFWPAVAINLSLYSATHIPKGPGETFGAVVFGLLLCYITVSTQSLATAFFAHLTMALSNEFFSVHHHPEMKFV